MSENNNKSWWEAVGAIGAVIAALASVGSVYYAYQTVREADDDARDARKQQQAMFQGNVMSDCMQQYFAIRSDAANNWNPQSTNTVEQQKVQDLYSERMYGLHFKEYHLFRQDAIPTHVYTIWIQSFRGEVLHTSTNEVLSFGKYYPPLANVGQYIARDTNEDFNIFFTKILKAESNQEIVRLVSNEANMPPYP